MKYTLTVFCLFLASLSALAQEHEQEADIDVWQTLKVAASRDPFATTNEFSINFANYTQDEWCYPLPGAHVISPFGGARHHAGTDVKRNPNDTIRAVFAGEVITSGPYYAYGNCVILRHANGLETLYSHNSKNLVKVGDWVVPGEPLALEGRTGRATTEHLHFETRVKGRAFDSSQIFDHENHRLLRKVVVFTKRKDGRVSIRYKCLK